MESNSQYLLQENYTFQVGSFLYTQNNGAWFEDGISVAKTGVDEMST
jgi:hypothetical protein